MDGFSLTDGTAASVIRQTDLVYVQFDQNQDGFLEESEIVPLFPDQGLETWNFLLEQRDFNNDSRVSRQEYLMVEELIASFKLVDTNIGNNDEYLSLEEIIEASGGGGGFSDREEEEFARRLTYFDRDGDGRLDETEWIHFNTEQFQTTELMKAMNDFNDIDTNGDGYITQDDLVRLVLHFPDAAWEAFKDGRDTDGDDRLSFEEIYYGTMVTR